MSVRVAVVQMCSDTDVEANLKSAAPLVRDAAAAGAELIGLPENFAYLGPEAQKVELAESLDGKNDGPILSWLRDLATELGVTLVGGGMPETSEDPSRVYNTCVVVGPTGDVLATYRKIHLFDVELPVAGGRGLKESDSVVPGAEPVTVDLAWGRVGLSVCYDLRFPELYRALAQAGAVALMVPSAFTLQTGKDHWEVLLRARAIENQAYVLAPAQAGTHSAKRSSWGKAMIVDPWGAVVAGAGDRITAVCADLDLAYLEDVRSRLPALHHRRL